MFIWILYGFVALVLALFVFPFLRMVGLNSIFSTLITMLAMFGGIFLAKIYIAVPFLTWEFEHHLSSHYPLIEMVKKNAPGDYEQYINNIRMSIQHISGLDVENEIFYSSIFVNQLLINYGPYATDENIYNFFRVNLNYDKELYGKNPFFVLFHEFPEKFSPEELNLKTIDPKRYLFNLFYNAEAIISSGFSKAQSAPTPEDKKSAEIIFKSILDDLSKVYNVKNIRQVFVNPENLMVSDQLAAKIVIDFYDKILAKDKQKASLVLRVMLFSNSTVQQ